MVGIQADPDSLAWTPIPQLTIPGGVSRHLQCTAGPNRNQLQHAVCSFPLAYV
jgi:hypothetical protein